MSKVTKVQKSQVNQEAKPAKQDEKQAVTVVEETEQETEQEMQPVVNEVLDEKTLTRQSQYKELLKKIDNSQQQLGTLKSELKKFYKQVEKDVTKAGGKKSHRGNHERPPTGFSKLGNVPEGLCTLLNIDNTVGMARPDVTKKLYEYIDSHNLRDPHDKRIMRVNSDFAKVFNLSPKQVKYINETEDIKDKDGFNFYNIQKFLKSVYDGTAKKVTEQETDPETEVEELVQVKGRGKKVSTKSN
jgi:chromatin remodeling complex protein RSC6